MDTCTTYGGMNEANILINALANKEKLVAMVAPSFPIVFPYPAIITMLKKIGFSYVVEVAAGAQETNKQLLELMKNNPNARYITSPCPTIVRLFRNQMKQYLKYLPEGVDSPMAATAKIVHDKYPGYRPVFIGPCVVKKYEAIEDEPALNILVLTFTELQQVFDYFAVDVQANSHDTFDIESSEITRMYAVDGGLSHSSGLSKQLPPKAVRVVSGWKDNMTTLKEFENDPDIKLLDILNCPGGCIFGPGIKSMLTLEERKKKIQEYMDMSDTTDRISRSDT